MGTTIGVLKNLGPGRPIYREFASKLGLVLGSRAYPRCITTAMRGYRLGLHERSWYSHKPRGTGAETYWVKVVPIFADITDPDDTAILGTPTADISTRGVTFEFDPFPIEYPCNGYHVYAHNGTTEDAESYHYQGELNGRFNTYFVVGTTWTYSETGGDLTEQTIGPPAFATAAEVYQVEGAVDSRLFLGGGVKYETGYAQVASATAAPYLTCGTGAEDDYTVWAAITNGSFRMRLGWSETVDYDEYFDYTGINFTGDASMANVASTLQTAIRAAQGPVLFCGTNEETGMSAWTAISDGSFQLWVDGQVVQVTSCDTSGDSSLSEVAATIQAAWRTASGGSTETVTYDTTAERFIFKTNPASPDASDLLSYLEPHSSGTGTDISGMLDGRDNGTDVVLNRRGKGATTETVAWSTDHFVITGPDSGDAYRFSYLEEATANVGTDISVAAYMDAVYTSTSCVYTPGKTVGVTVTGDGTNWGDWAIGTKFKLGSESAEYIVQDVVDTEHLVLDSTYTGFGFNTWNAYALLPYDDQIYASALGNPFKYDTDDIVRVPTANSDRIIAFKTLGRNIAVFQRNHVWVIDGVDIGAPRMISEDYGAINDASIIRYKNGLAFFTGTDFMYLKGGRIESLDPEGRVKEIISRWSSNTLEPHGVLMKGAKRDLMIWWLGLDSSFKYDTGVVLDPENGNWWLYNHKDANASAVIVDSNGSPHLITGSTYDSAHGAKAFTFIHDSDYFNDGASTDENKDKQGIINTVGTATTTAGYLTCAAAGSAIAAWQAIENGYFDITIDDIEYTVGPCDFSGDSDFDDVADTIEAAIQVQTSGAETCAYSTDHFVITSGTTTNRSNISYARCYHGTDATDISSKTYMNGREGYATTTGAVTQVTLTLDTFGSTTAALSTDADGEEGIWVYVCDTDLQNGQYALVASNTASTITVTPNFSTTPEAGWYWFLGGIVPIWRKWTDFGSPQHRNRMYGVSVTVQPETQSTGNYLGIQGMQDLSTTERTAKVEQIGGSNDSTQTFELKDQPATTHGIQIKRPNSEVGLKVESVVMVHTPRV